MRLALMSFITCSSTRTITLTWCMAGFAALQAPAIAQHVPAAARYASDYSNVRGFNYTASGARGYAAQWQQYNHDEVDREMGYAAKLNLNLARVFLSYNAWLADKATF